ncbi:RNA exonuclease Rex3 [Penicillium angulare]|uniref:RNA exonuclease 3 n=1 Tax=Penicillium angulare TaxID=116970 RepID=A0A9W9F4L8_9EURO|nr:RNA exonuclease Rex3 [Penicillium angulare]
MFTTLGLFDSVPCPEGKQCSLTTCMFSHKIQASNSIANEKRASSSTNDEHVSKRLKIDGNSTPSKSTSNTSRVTPNIQRPAKASVSAAGSNQNTHPVSQDISRLPSISRKVSPPPSGRTGSQSASKASPLKSANASSGPVPSQLPPRKVPKESLNPRMLQKAPATHTARSAILKKLHGAMSSLNEKIAKENDTSNKCFVLNKDELVTMALDEEEKVAKNSAGVYSNVIKLRIVKLTKMGKEDWTKEVMEHLNSRYYHIQPIQPQSLKSSKPITTGLSTKEEVLLAGALVTPLLGLEEFGYVTKAPSLSDVETAKRGVIESKGWEKCDRCGGRFQVFPGRREDGTLASGGPCTYHPSRPIYPPRKKTDGVTGSSEAYFSCCSESVGTSTGCTKAKTHVYKVSEVKRLASILQFETTPTQQDKNDLGPVSFDCEMGYTTMGLELIRLTAVSWPEGNELLDILVKPMGEVLDLNSRYSGVFPEHYASAIPYGTSVKQTNSSDQKSEKDHKPLQVVESPAAARALLFGLIQPQTPLIGHAIDNDLNACRVIHPTIIDTVLLYPHPGRLPNRMGLKVLSRKFLERDIQMGGDQGHDSKEDSIATGDLVRVKAGELWKRLRAKGWKFEDNHIIAPPGQASQDIRKAAHELGFATGYKRKSTSNT